MANKKIVIECPKKDVLYEKIKSQKDKANPTNREIMTVLQDLVDLVLERG
ncbi:hypothetical protein [Dehalobacter restrictus]|uniref:Uncharacterized protein n=1 Tax=Dehalobacter restrictus TaxID=55583 RepID=A0A857DHY2_9FIRM|nr:hypothetical protein [Dehalobacter restrictus]QHA00527.1 hypothetical protein GQ588_07735 [Dehalobacter restrictus]